MPRHLGMAAALAHRENAPVRNGYGELLHLVFQLVDARFVFLERLFYIAGGTSHGKGGCQHNYYQSFHNYIILRNTSQRTIPTDTDTLSECLVPSCGISRAMSHRSITSCETPLTSLPKTKA